MQPYTLIRSRRKTLSLELARDGSAVVRAPLRCPRAEIDRFVQRHEQWILTHRQRLQQRQASHPEPTPEQAAAMIRRAKEILPGKVEHYSALMGVTPTGITVTGARTRFGSCSPKNRLCFSWRLMDYPQEAIDYVVVHELAHIRHKDHSPAFHAFVASVLPDHRERRALLRR